MEPKIKRLATAIDDYNSAVELRDHAHSLPERMQSTIRLCDAHLELKKRLALATQPELKVVAS